MTREALWHAKHSGDISARSNDADMVSEKLSWPSSKDLVGRGWVGCMKSVLSIGGNLSV
jgi:hypothetical protein